MEPYRYRVFVCTNLRDGEKSSCSLRDSNKTLQALRQELEKRGLQFDVKAVECGCLGLCQKGPNLIVYPGGTWYSDLTAEFVEEFVETQIVKGEKFEKKAWDERELKKVFDAKRERKKMESQSS